MQDGRELCWDIFAAIEQQGDTAVAEIDYRCGLQRAVDYRIGFRAGERNALPFARVGGGLWRWGGVSGG